MNRAFADTFRGLAGLAIGLTVSACAASQDASLSAALLPLPTAQPTESGVVLTCSEVLAPAVVRGSSLDSRVTWLQLFDGRRVEIIWPAGYVARFVPLLEVLDEAQRPVMRDGDFVDGSCEIGDRGGRLMDPPFYGFQLDCGPLAVEDCTSARLRAVAESNGWPQRQIDWIRFLAVEGTYVVRFEDGSENRGTSSGR
jgi:hypothetical protein